MTVKTPIAPRQTKPELEHDYVRSPALGYESPETAGFIRCHSEGRVFRCGLDGDACGHLRHAVSVAHPDGVTLTHFPQAIEQGAVFLDLHISAAKLRSMATFHHAT